MKSIIYPKSIQKGDKIAIISPAGSVEKAQLQSTLDLIKEKGYQPILGKNALKNYDYGYSYAGTEQQRIDDINWALNDKEIKAVWATRGGYGSQHLLQHIELKQFKKNPKWYVGYSDNTAIQSFLQKKGFASIHGQTIKTSSFGVSDDSYEVIFEILKGKVPYYQIKANKFNKKGKASGELIGGNLALIYALLGTNFTSDFKDKILFIEDIGENFYALDRMLMSLELAGVFKKIKGLIVGGMTNMGKEEDNKSYDQAFDPMANRIIQHRLHGYNFPILYQFPNGHIEDNLPLIIGAEVSLKVSKNPQVIFK